MNTQKLIDNFSSHLKNVIARAISIASYHETVRVEPIHLVAALIQEKGSIAAQMLTKHNITEEAVNPLVEALRPAMTAAHNHPATKQLPDLSARSRTVLEKALVVAYDRSHNYIGTEHLLHGILQTKSKDTETLFRVQQVDLDTLLSHVEGTLNNTSRFSGMEEMSEMLEDLGQLPPATQTPDETNTMLASAKRDREQKAVDFFTTNLTSKRVQKNIDPVIGREEEIERIIHILARRTKNNPILVGEPGVGKTAIVEGLAKRISNGDVPALLRGSKILSLDMTALVAGTIYRGEFEARLKQIVEEVADDDRAILFIDELHTIIGAGSNHGAMDAANILKPALARGTLRCIGATTHDEYKKYIVADPALERRFQHIDVDEPTQEQTREILSGVKKYYESHHHVIIDDSALDAALSYSNRYIHDQYQPDKSLDLLDEASALVRARKKPTAHEQKIHALRDSLDMLAQEKELAIDQERLEDAVSYKQKEEEAAKKLEKLQKTKGKGKGRRLRVTEADIVSVLSNRLKISKDIIEKSDFEQLKTLSSRLQTHLVGQDMAIDHVVRAITRGYMRNQNSNRPLASLLLAGPSGVGKTELGRRIAQELYHDKNALIRLDMSEFSEAHSVSKILGSPAGYVGFKDRNLITDEMKRRPYSVILFDEIDKAHADVMRLLLQILDEGHLSDSSGKKIHFKHSIIVLTTDLGADLFHSAGIGFGSLDSTGNDHRVKDAVKDALKSELSSALLSRVTDTILMHPLSKEHIGSIIQKKISELSEELASSQDIAISAEKSALESLTEELYNPKHGARHIDTKIEHMLHELALEVLSQTPKKAYTLCFDKEHYRLT